MGRKRVRSDPYHPLPKGLYPHGRNFRARDRLGNWKRFDGPQKPAVEAYHAWRLSSTPDYADSIAWLLDQFALEVCPQRVRGELMSARTALDYRNDRAILNAGLGKIPMASLAPFHIARFRDVRAETNPTHVRNELACLSAALSWAVDQGYITRNPCLEVRRPSRRKRQRLISDGEYMKVHSIAPASVQLAMLIAVRTLALPGDILSFAPANVVTSGEKRVLRFQRNKTGALVTVELVGELGEAIEAALDDPCVKFRNAPFVHTRLRRPDDHGKPNAHPPAPYTVSGIRAIFQRCCAKAEVTDFGLRDLRAKGATDMYRAGIDIRQIQQLLGHSTEATTRIYLKGYVGEIVKPNMVPIIAGLPTLQKPSPQQD